MPTTCDISFDNPEKVYYAGQMLRGTVRLTLTKEHKVRGVYVRIFGRAYAYWTEHCSSNHNSHRSDGNRRSGGHSVSYTGEEDYLDEKTYFVGGPNASEFRLAPGTETYSFACMLPAGLPTSVEHEVGHITYGVTVVMDIPLWVDKDWKEHFTVIKPINLNADLSLRSPAVDRDDRVFYPLGCFCCWPSGPLTTDASTPVRGYTPGQTINVKVNANNESDETITSFDVELIKEITFHGTGYHNGITETKEKKVYHVITGEETRGCSRAQKVALCANLRVPPIPPTDFSTSTVVKVNYLIHVEGHIDACCRENVKLDMPVIIGTYPIQDFDQASNAISYPEPVISSQPTAPQTPMAVPAPNVPPMPMPMPMPPLPNQNSALPYPIMPSAPSLPANSNIVTAPFDPNENDDPPTYEEATGTGEQNENKFTPKYPMFRRQTSYSIDKI